MKIKKVRIKGIIRRLIKEDGIWKYWKHRCKHCEERVPYKESNKTNGVPDFINGHQTKGEFNPNNGKHWSEEVTEKISKSLTGKHQTIKTRKKRGISIKKHYQDHPETREIQRKANLGRRQSSKMKENQSKFKKQWWENNQDKLAETIERMHKAGKQYDTSIELIVYAYLLKLFPDYIIVKQQKIIDYENNKLYKVDFYIVELKAVVEVNGCYHHECVDCYPLTEDIYETSKKQHEDIIRIKRLRQMGHNIILIWNHDIDNGNYKKIIKRLIADIKDPEDH